MNKIKWVFIGAVAALLCACASSGSGSGIQVSSQSATQYPAVPTSACRVSSYPPKGAYTVIAQMKATGQVGETATQVLNRLQQQGAAMGSTYVMVMSVSDKKFVTPQNSEIADNPYLSQEASFFGTANSDSSVSAPAQTTAPVVKAQALKITSGSNKPNKGAPSNLWQLRPN